MSKHRKDQESLTKRELEVLRSVAQGMSSKEVGDNLHISKRTIDFHLGNIYRRLDLKNRTDAVMYGIRKGYIEVV